MIVKRKISRLQAVAHACYCIMDTLTALANENTSEEISNLRDAVKPLLEPIIRGTSWHHATVDESPSDDSSPETNH